MPDTSMLPESDTAADAHSTTSEAARRGLGISCSFRKTGAASEAIDVD
jgi:hypothetical protein